MKALFAVFAALVCLSWASFEPEWLEWKKEHDKVYKDLTEETYRHGVWKHNLDMIEAHNKLADEGKETYWMGMNQLGDLTREEVVHTFNGLLAKDNENSTNNFNPTPNFIPEDNVDWRTKGAVTPVKNQGQCGSCWAFSATGSLEGQHFLKDGQLVSLSEQNLIDCSKTKDGNQGCYGGLMDYAFEYVIHNKGIDTEASYPYQAENHKCRFSSANIGATEKSYRNIFKGSVLALVEASSKIGPISAGMDASWGSFHMYKKGVYSESKCSSRKLDHGVLVVGYGTTEDGEEYFLVKNSWGTKWGMDGYFMISRKHNMCGIASQASYPIV